MSDPRLNVYSVQTSIHGELPFQGLPVCIVRLSGCSSKCRDCDSEKSLSGKHKRITADQIVRKITKERIKSVLITGGEPLEQNQSIELMRRLIKFGYKVTLETNGSLPVKRVPRKATIVMDIKVPSQKSKNKTLKSNFKYLKKTDLIKIVVANEKDYKWAKKFISDHLSEILCEVVFSCIYGKISPKRLARLLIKDKSKNRMQIQLHKYLGMK